MVGREGRISAIPSRATQTSYSVADFADGMLFRAYNVSSQAENERFSRHVVIDAPKTNPRVSPDEANTRKKLLQWPASLGASLFR
jgi:hypothetical protein